MIRVYRPISEAQKQAISKAMKGNKNHLKLIGRKHSLEWRMNISKSLRGAKSHLWKGELTDKDQQIRNSIEYREWRKNVYERDNYTCVLCGCNRRNYLEADHIVELKENTDRKLAFDINNGRTLCKSCHRTRHNKIKFAK